MATGSAAVGSGLFKFLRPRRRPQATDIAAAATWGVAAIASALWLTQPSAGWFKKLLSKPEPEK